MGRSTTMVLVDAMQVFNETDLSQAFEDDETAEHYAGAVARLAEHFTEDYCSLLSAVPCDVDLDKLSDGIIGYWEPERLISQVEKYHTQNISLAKGKLKDAADFFEKHNVTLEFVLNPDNFDTITSDDYIEGHWKLADCFAILSGRERDDLSFYDLTDSSARISKQQKKSIRENPEVYALIPITYKC